MEKLKMFDLQEAYVLTKTGSKGSKIYQVMIVTPFGDFALITPSSDLGWIYALFSWLIKLCRR